MPMRSGRAPRRSRARSACSPSFRRFEQTLEKFGVTTDGVGTTPLAGALRVDRTLTPEAKEILQSSVEHAYSMFIGHVAAARKKSVEEIDAVAQGRVWAGIDAATAWPGRQARLVS